MPKDALKEFVNLRQLLTAERESIEKRLSAIDAALGGGGGEIPLSRAATPGKATQPKATRRPAKRIKNPMSLREAIIKVTSDAPKTKKEILSAIKTRLHERAGFNYDAAWNLTHRTNNALVQTFGVNNANELTGGTQTGSLTVGGVTATDLNTLSVNGSLLDPDDEIYSDGSFAREGYLLTNGINTFTARAEDWYGRKATNVSSVTVATNVVYSYDLNGNLTSDGSRTFEYDTENQLTNVYVSGKWRSEFKYDGLNRRRITRDFKWQSSVWVLTNEVRYIFDQLLAVQERGANGVARVSYTRGLDLSGDLQDAGGIGGLLARTDNPEMVQGGTTPHAYYFSDGNGNVTGLISTNKTILAQYHYDPFGNILVMSGPMAEINAYRFSSKEFLGKASIYYYGYRFYDPNLQRWLNKDPIGEKGSQNLHAFVSNNPLSKYDSFGLCDLFVLAGGELAAGNLGVNLSVGLVIDTDSPGESGINFTAGKAVGMTAGVGVGGGAALRDIEGKGANVDVNALLYSGSAGFDDQGLNSLAVTKGPGVGAALSTTEGKTITANDVVDALSDILYDGLYAERRDTSNDLRSPSVNHNSVPDSATCP